MASIKNRILDRYFEPVEENEENNNSKIEEVEMEEEIKVTPTIEVESTVVENPISVVLKPTIISQGTEIQGHFMAENDLELRGRIVGDVDIEGNLIVEGGSIIGDVRAKSISLKEAQITGNMVSQGFIEIYSHSVVEGDIQGQNVSLDGECKGNIKTTDSLYLMSNACSKGNIVATRLKVDDGAFIDGQIKMKR